MAKPKPLGRQLLETYNSLTELIGKTHDPDRLKELESQSDKLMKQIAALVDATLDKESDEYKKAQQELDKASEAIDDALKGLDSTANAITAIAKVLEAVASLIPA